MRWLERKRALVGMGAVGALVLSGAVVAIVSPSRPVATRFASLGRVGVNPTGPIPKVSAGGAIPTNGVRNGAGSASSAGSGSALAAPTPASVARGTGPAQTTGPAGAPDAIATPVPNAGPQVVRTGDLTLQVSKGGFQNAFDRASSIAQEMGGFVVTSSVGQPGPIPVEGGVEGIDPTVTQPSDTRPADAPAPTSGSLDIRVPGDRFNDARHALEGLSTKVLTEQLRGNDASGQLIDLSARINNLEAEETSLRTIEARAGSISDVLQVQNQLTEVQTQIEALKAEQAALGNQVALASIHVELQEPGVALSPTSPKPRSELARSWSRAGAGVEAVTGGMLIVLGYTAPVAVLAGLAWAIGAWALRRRRGLPAPAA